MLFATLTVLSIINSIRRILVQVCFHLYTCRYIHFLASVAAGLRIVGVAILPPRLNGIFCLAEFRGGAFSAKIIPRWPDPQKSGERPDSS